MVSGTHCISIEKFVWRAVSSVQLFEMAESKMDPKTCHKTLLLNRKQPILQQCLCFEASTYSDATEVARFDN